MSSAFLLLCLVLCFENGAQGIDEYSEEIVDVYEKSRIENKTYTWDFRHTLISTTPAFEIAVQGADKAVHAAQAGVDLFNIKEDQSSECTGSITVDAQRFNLIIAYKTRWIGGSADQISCRTQRCFDGKIFGSVVRSLAGGSFPKNTNIPDESCVTLADIGAFTNEREQIDHELAKSGLCAIPPNFPVPFYSTLGSVELPKLLSDSRMKSIDSVRSFRGSEGAICLEIAPPAVDNSEFVFAYVINPSGRVDRVDLKLGDVVVKTCIFQYSGTSPLGLAAMDWVNGRGYRISFSNFKELIKPNDSIFRVSVPDGALVNDMDRGIQYTAGVTTKNEANRLAEYVKANELQGFPVRNNQFLYGVFVIVGILILAVAYKFLRNRPQETLGLMAIMLFSGTTFSNDTSNDRESKPKWDGMDWKIDLGASEQICIRQCGFIATSVVLNILCPEFNPTEVARYLEPTKDGVRFDRMKSVLEAHGVNVTAYKDTNLRKLLKSLGNGDIAIIAISKIGIATPHYVVLASDPLGKRLWIDYPLEPSDLGLWKPEEIDLISECVVLVCSKARKAKSPLVSIETDRISVGKADFSNGIYKGSIRIENCGQSPAICLKIKKSCSCVSTEPQSTFTIDGGQSVNFSFGLKYEDFIERETPARLAFEFASGDVLEFTAEVRVPATDKQITPHIFTRCRIIADSYQVDENKGLSGLIECPWLLKFDFSSIAYKHPDWMSVERDGDKLHILISPSSDALEQYKRRGRIADTLQLIDSSNSRVIAEVVFEIMRPES